MSAARTAGEGTARRSPARRHRTSQRVARRAAAREGSEAYPWFLRVDWQSSIWIAFLLIPLIAVLRSDLEATARLLTAAGIVAFMAVYVWTVSTMPVWEDLPPEAGLVQQLRPVALPLVIMAALAVGTGLVLTWWTPYYLPYFAGVILFATPLVTGVTAVTVACASVVLTVIALGAPVESRWMAVGCTLSSLSIVAGRVGAEVSERRRLAERELVAAGEREEISRDVHDILGHSLTVLTLKAEVAQRLVRTDPERTEAELAEIVDLSRAALADVRATVTRLRTPDLAGQVEASRTAFAAADVELELSGRAKDVPLPQRELLSWALREATTNVLRHAGASRVRVELQPGRLLVVDDGAGTAGRRPGNGLTGLRQRVEDAGGALVLTSPAPEGHRRWGARDDDGTVRAAGPGTVLEVTL